MTLYPNADNISNYHSLDLCKIALILFQCKNTVSPFGTLPAAADVVYLLPKRKWIILAAVTRHRPIVVLVQVEDLLVGTQVHWLDKTKTLVVLRQVVRHRVESVIVHYQIVRIVLLHTSHCPPEIMRASYLQSIAQVNIVVIGIVEGNNSLQSLKLRHHSKNAHRLSPAMTVGPLCRQEKFVAKPFGDLTVKEQHAGVHIDSSFVVEQLVAEHISHSCTFGVPAARLHVVDSVEQVVAEWKSLAGDILSGPYFELKIGVFLPIHLKHLLLSLRHFSINPHKVENSRYNLRLVALSVRLILQCRIKHCELLHRNAILDKMVHIVGHRIGLRFVVVHPQLMIIDCIPTCSADDDVVRGYDAVGHIEDVRVAFDEPLHSLPMWDLSVIVFVRHILHHVQEVLQKVESIVEVHSCMCAQIELRNYFVAVRVEHSQMIYYSLKIAYLWVFAIVLELVVICVGVAWEERVAVVVEADEGTQHSSRRYKIDHKFKCLRISKQLGPFQHEDK